MPSQNLYLPPQYRVQASAHGAIVEQLEHPGLVIQEASPIPATLDGVRGYQFNLPSGEPVFVTKRRFALTESGWHVLLADDGLFPASTEEAQRTRARWMTPVPLPLPATDEHARHVRRSWTGRVSIVEEQENEETQEILSGLRSPQVGALYAALAHWKTSEEPATIVMPTGTGKTETMLTAFVHQRCERLLVVVPSDALRTQIGHKFVSMGLLRQLGILAAESLYPVTARLTKSLQIEQQVDEVFIPCNVVITTMDILHRCAEPALQRMVDHCSHVFIDEAHHISAPTWTQVKQAFAVRRILQFTATPFRNDRKHVEGKIIFNYPLAKAQQEEYFKLIRFQHIWEFNPEAADQAIAQIAVETLAADAADGHEHLIMARTNKVERAKQVIKYYEAYPGLNPVLIHSDLPDKTKKACINDLRTGRSKVVVCVNMLGEGFDLPELKIAAIHDPHKSLAITLQFTGRFTRFKRTLGDAMVIVNLADAEVQAEIRELFAEDADWNVLLRQLSGATTGRQEDLSEFFRGFEPLPKFYSLQNVTPKMSTVVYATPAEAWRLEALDELFKPEQRLDPPSINAQRNVVAVVTKQSESVEWGTTRELRDTVWDLHLLYWNADQRLLYINSTVRGTMHEELAKALFGPTVVMKRGNDVFRILHGITRLALTNLGLSHIIGGAVRFTMHMGSDVFQGLSQASQTGKGKSNTFGYGYRDAKQVTAGCSVKGKIWAYRTAGTVLQWVEWCDEVGEKILDETINAEEIFKHLVKSEPLEQRPEAVPLGMEWSDSVLARPEHTVEFTINGISFPLYEVGLRVLTLDDYNPIRFELFSDGHSAVYEMVFVDKRASYQPISGAVSVLSGRKSYSLTDWLEKEPPTFFFHDRSMIQYNTLLKIEPDHLPYDTDKIVDWDWTGVNLKLESQGLARSSNTIQYRVIQELKKAGYDVIFDDDDSYEAADVVAIRATLDKIRIELYHCKFSQETTPGARIKDLYEVCGQAQKSVHWYHDPVQLFKHLQLREGNRAKQGKASRFDIGTVAKLKELEKRARVLPVEMAVYIVQPGLSKAQVSEDQLDLLAVTELYLMETYQLPFTVICSA
ncbi:DEAD/DEAH box helicase [Hymenobacter metallicola]|uniref:DEAD/DEAH box helicase n=1 Tax=Hymenobacter metallicola TaxID=2563114 RepID=A0A4Z0Q0L9_9BACT|nr:DEAD/DEAH box helicase family protein [Hymenobacter metallicola]TGE22703.1 DEAD/DEAH box helicase [Hymenobacter metallicola]